MKKLAYALVSALSLVSLAAQAETYSSIDLVREVSLKNNELSIAYEVGGGCAQHEASIAIRLEEKSGRHVAKVQVMDVASEEDRCEGIVYVSGKANLRDLIEEQAARLGLSDEAKRAIGIELPQVALSLDAQ